MMQASEATMSTSTRSKAMCSASTSSVKSSEGLYHSLKYIIDRKISNLLKFHTPCHISFVHQILHESLTLFVKFKIPVSTKLVYSVFTEAPLELCIEPLRGRPIRIGPLRWFVVNHMRRKQCDMKSTWWMSFTTPNSSSSMRHSTKPARWSWS